MKVGIANDKGNKKVSIAVPLEQDKLSLHLGHCDKLAIFDIDYNVNKAINRKVAESNTHVPGVLPKWLHENNVGIIIAGSMGQRAKQLFTENDIKVVTGASGQVPEELVLTYLEGILYTGDNICDY